MVTAVVVGIIAAVVCALSPLTAMWLIAGPWLIWTATRALPARERRVIRWLCTLALGVRAALIAGLFATGGFDSQSAAILVPDEAYTLGRTWRLRNILIEMPALKYDYVIAFEDYGKTSYLWFATAVQWLLGPAPYGLRVVNTVFFVTGSLLLHRLARRSFGPLPAALALALLLFLPTWLLWSVSLLKESLYFLLVATTLAAVDGIVRSHRWRSRLGLVLVAVLSVYVLRDLRGGAVALVISGLGVGLVCALLSTSVRRVVAGAALVGVLAGVVWLQPAIQARVVDGIRSAARAHVGHVFTVGHPYKLLDEGFYVTMNPEPTLTSAEAARFVIRSAASIVAVPLPSQVATRGELAQVPEHVVWLVLVALTPFGIAAGLSRDRLLTCLLVGFVVPTAIVVSMTNGNVGTLIRFRGLLTPYLVWVASLGLCVIMQRVLVSAHAR
jgi:hypothetical protein